jgi:hypothetical protein
MKIILPLMRLTSGTVLFGDQNDRSLPISNVYVRKGTIIDGKDVASLKSITITVSAGD